MYENLAEIYEDSIKGTKDIESMVTTGWMINLILRTEEYDPNRMYYVDKTGIRLWTHIEDGTVANASVSG